jgi:hypothetical protein
VSAGALDDLRALMLADAPTEPSATPGASEAAIQSQLRVDWSKQGDRLWRNNVGVLPDARGVPIRFGLANDSGAINSVLKSSDLIGIRRRLITPDMIGQVFGQFAAREAKKAGWRFAGTARELAQLKFIELVNALGGDARFTTGDDA